MKNILFTIAFLLCGVMSYAQKTVNPPKPKLKPVIDTYRGCFITDQPKLKPYRGCFITDQPIFPSGEIGFMNYIKKNMQYPPKAKENKIEGKVFVSLIIEKDGSVTNVKLVKGIGYGCDDEAIRLIKNSPKWKAGKRWNGKLRKHELARIRMAIPIFFKLKNISN